MQSCTFPCKKHSFLQHLVTAARLETITRKSRQTEHAARAGPLSHDSSFWREVLAKNNEARMVLLHMDCEKGSQPRGEDTFHLDRNRGNRPPRKLDYTEGHSSILFPLKFLWSPLLILPLWNVNLAPSCTLKSGRLLSEPAQTGCE